MEKLLYFPEIYPNEDFRSIIYRYHLWSGNNEFRDTKKELFDISSAKLGLFPRNLLMLINKFSEECRISENDLLSLTWFPLFRPFLTKDRLSIVKKDIMYGKNWPSSSLGKVAIQRKHAILSKEIQYCQVCMLEDEKKYGVSYVHLNHQLYFIDFCPKHRVILTDKCKQCNAPLSNRNSGNLAIKACCKNVVHEKITNNKISDFKLFLLNEINYFKDYAVEINCKTLFAKVTALLGSNGYMSIKGKVNKTRLLDDLINNYKEKCPDIIKVFEDSLNKKYFLQEKHMAKSILMYILIILFLRGSIKEFFKKQEGYSFPLPFGPGPWPCYNNRCSSFDNGTSISRCQRILTYKGFKGRFLCPNCGFEYEREWDETVVCDEVSLRNKEYLLFNKMSELHDLGYKLNEIANILNTNLGNVSNYLKRKKQDGRNKKLFKESSNKNTLIDRTLKRSSELVATIDLNDVINKYRKKITDIKKVNEDINRTKLNKLAGKEYKWLNENDNEWLDKQFPSKSLNYTSMDQDLQLKVRLAAKKLYTSKPSNRIKKYTILKNMAIKDKNIIVTHEEKLPKTTEELKQRIETIEDFQVRRIPTIVSQLKLYKRIKNITFDSITGVSKSYNNCTEETKKRVEAKLLEILNEE